MVADRQPLDSDMREMLSELDVAPLVEYVAERLHQADGHRTLVFELSEGRLRRARLDHGPVGTVELERIARA